VVEQNPSSRVPLVVALVTAVAGALLLGVYVQRLQREISGGSPISLLALREDLAAGSRLDEAHLVSHDVPETYVESRQVRASELAKVLGVRTAVPLEAHHTLSWTDLDSTTRHARILSEHVPSGMRAISVPSGGRLGIGSLMRPGDRVDVLVTRIREDGRSVTIPLLLRNQLPTGINHFRVGEALFFGKNLFTDGVIEGMSDRVLELYTQIIELSEKPKVPMGELGVNPQGETAQVAEEDVGKTSYRAIIDIGVLDIQPNYLIPVDKNITISDASSDMLVLDVGSNPKGYKVGDTIRFKLKYMGALGLMSSDYIEKKVAD